MQSTKNLSFGRPSRSFRTPDLKRNSGFLLVEVLVVSGVLVVGILIILEMFMIMKKNVTIERGRLNALNEARRKLEYIKSLSYDEVGVGLPATNPAYLGHLETNYASPQYDAGVDILFQDSVPLGNGIIGKRWVIVQAIDDPMDGLGGLDEDKAANDYKKVTVAVRWKEKSTPMEISVGTIISGTSEKVVAGGGNSDMALNKKTEQTGVGAMGMGATPHNESLGADEADETDVTYTGPDSIGETVKYPEKSARRDHH